MGPEDGTREGAGSPSEETVLWNPPPTAGVGVSTRTHVANGEGSCPPPCGPDTEQ